MYHILAQYGFEGIFGFLCVGFKKKFLQVLLYPSTLQSKTPSSGGVFDNKTHPKHVYIYMRCVFHNNGSCKC